MSNTLKNYILKEIDAISWDTTEGADNSDVTHEAIITGFYNYLTTEYIITGTLVGTATQPLTPIPWAGNTTHKLSVTGTPGGYLNIWKPIVKSGVASGGISRMFTALQSILSTPPIMLTIDTLTDVPSVIPATIVPPLKVPAMPVVFPSMVSFGSPCQSEMMGSKPTDRDEAWSIIAKWIHTGLGIHTIPPIPTNGVQPNGFPAVGVTTAPLITWS